MSTHANLTAATSDMLRALTVIDERLAVMRDAQRGQPGAQRFGDIRSAGRTVCWCERHECDVQDCHEANRLCNGVTIAVSDPTGEAAMQGDKARDSLRRLEKLSEALAKNADAVVRELTAWAPNVVVNDRGGIGVCDDCGKYCEGGKDRLRPHGEHRYCDACRKRSARFKPVAS